MKLTWKKKDKKRPLAAITDLPFDPQEDLPNPTQERCKPDTAATIFGEVSGASRTDDSDTTQLAESFQAQGNMLAEDGRYHEALVKWEAALTIMPEKAALHEQKAQVLLEIGEAWKSLRAATRATELEPSWAEAWVTLGRAQLNFGEPDSAIESFDKALAIKPESVEAREDRRTALHLVKKRKQLHSSGLSDAENRYAVGEKVHECT